MSRPPITGLYAITDPTLTPDDALLGACHAALRGGVRLLQYRDKTAPPQRQQQRAKQLQALCQQYGAQLIINDNVDLALACGAAGVHLGQSDGDIALARQRLGDGAIIGVTCHNSLQLARQAEQAGASYAAFGRLFPSHSKPQAPPASLATLRQATRTLTLPVVAIGGINADNASQVLACGVPVLAMIHGLFAAADIEQQAHQLNHLILQAQLKQQ